ncbi:MAG TPA: TetR family transcriptional regulator [Streptosporangiaceae bacterium]
MTSDPGGTRQRIFDAAVEEFAAHGNAGARVDRIAEKARANKESIYRYFGTKDELLRRVLDFFLDERGQQLLPQSRDMDEYAAGLFRYFAAHPEFLRLSLWEGLEFGAPHGSTVEHRRQHYQDKLASIAEQQRAGTIDPDLDPRHLLVVILGVANYWHVLPQLVRIIFGEEPDAATLARHEQFVAEAVRRIVAVPSGPAATPYSP